MKILGEAGVCLDGFTRQLRGERGSGTVMAVGLILLGVSLILGVAQTVVAAAGAVAAHEVVDLTVLMIATDVLTGGSGCVAVAEYAAKNRATLTSYQVNS